MTIEESQSAEAASKKAAKKAAKDAQKAAKKAEYKQAEKAQKTTTEEAEDGGQDYSEGKYGKSEMIQSADPHAERKFVDVHDLSKFLGQDAVWVRARVHTSRCKGKQCFMVLRQQSSTVQALFCVNDVISKQMVKFSGS